MFLLPFAVLAGNDNSQIFGKSATTSPAIPVLSKKEQKKEDIKKQLADTIDTCSGLVAKIQDLENRVTDRENILVLDNILAEETKIKLDLIQTKLDTILLAANEEVNNILPKLAAATANSSKPAKPEKDFKKEVNKFKTEIIDAHTLVLQMINLIKRDSVKFDDTDSASTTDEMATTSDQTSN